MHAPACLNCLRIDIRTISLLSLSLSLSLSLICLIATASATAANAAAERSLLPRCFSGAQLEPQFLIIEFFLLQRTRSFARVLQSPSPSAESCTQSCSHSHASLGLRLIARVGSEGRGGTSVQEMAIHESRSFGDTMSRWRPRLVCFRCIINTRQHTYIGSRFGFPRLSLYRTR